MTVFSRSTSTGRPSRLRDYGAFQVDVSTLNTLTIAAIEQPADMQDRLPPPLVYNSTQPANSRFPALTLPSQKPLKPSNTTGSSIRTAFLQRAQKVMLRKWPSTVVRLCMTVGLLVYLLKSLSWQTVLTTLTDVRLDSLLVGLVVGSFGIVLSAYQWRVLLHAQNIHFDLADLIKLYTIGITISHFLPTGFGGDAFKSFYVGRKSHNGVGATTATVMCRVTGFVAMLILVFPVLIILHQQFSFLLLLSFMLLCLLGCFVIVSILLLALLLPLLAKKRRARHRFFTRLADVGTILHQSVLMPRSLVYAILYGMTFWLVAILNCYIYANALGIHEQLTFYFLAVPLVAIIASMPFSLNGLGLREGAFVYVLSFVHVPSVTSLLLVLMLDLQMLFFAIIGSFIYITLGNGKNKKKLTGKK